MCVSRSCNIHNSVIIHYRTASYPTWLGRGPGRWRTSTFYYFLEFLCKNEFIKHLYFHNTMNRKRTSKFGPGLTEKILRSQICPTVKGCKLVDPVYGLLLAHVPKRSIRYFHDSPECLNIDLNDVQYISEPFRPACIEALEPENKERRAGIIKIDELVSLAKSIQDSAENLKSAMGNKEIFDKETFNKEAFDKELKEFASLSMQVGELSQDYYHMLMILLHTGNEHSSAAYETIMRNKETVKKYILENPPRELKIIANTSV